MVDSVGMHGSLSILRASGNKIGDGGAQALATLLRSTTTLHHLKLDGARKTAMGQGCELCCTVAMAALCHSTCLWDDL